MVRETETFDRKQGPIDAGGGANVDQLHISPATSKTRASFARSSASVNKLPATVLAKPHCELIAIRSRSI